MRDLFFGLFAVFVFYSLLMLACFAVVKLLPASFLGERAKAVLSWLPPFVGGDALRAWVAKNAEELTEKRLAGKRHAETADRLAAEIEEGAMHAMLPLAGLGDLERIVACPESGQGMVGVTAPEALTIAAYLRKNCSPAERQRIFEMAAENAKKIASRTPGDCPAPPLPCPLQGAGHVCCVYASRPLRCRILHAMDIAKDLGSHGEPAAGLRAGMTAESGHEQTVAEGIEIGVTRALKSAGVDAKVYELNGALATALAEPDAATRWAKGEAVFHTPLV
jgi:Fe-S-cluster containining protein